MNLLNCFSFGTTSLLLLFCGATLRGQVNPEWTTLQKPFRIGGNLYYVGSRDLAAFLIVTPSGNILINANLETSPPQIRAAVESLGFHWTDTKILLNGQAHFDHAAGTAEVIRQTGAKLMVMDGDADVMESGGKTDFAHLPPFPPAHVSRTLHDGDKVELGGTVLTALKTAGHTRGCTSFSMNVNEGGRKLRVVIVGGLAALDSYQLVSKPGHPESYPGIAADFERTFQTLGALHPDVFLGAHGSYFGMQAKLAKHGGDGVEKWIDPEGYRNAIEEAKKSFKQRLATERSKM